MEPYSFWEARWVEGRTGWHLSEIHPFLTKHASNLDFSPPKRVFIPLCGKCLELIWFYEKELETKDKRLKIYVASIYDINFDDIGKFDVIWDRGSQTAIEISDRDRYAKVMRGVCKEKFLYLMTTMQYDLEDDNDQPPRPISHEQTRKMFGDWCSIKLILENDVTDDRFRKRGIKEVFESYFVLTPK
ncbi:Thiopurine S-methyltransferase [Armadillidium nasatum]|uniref:Thiopurine S-methyltransferase n=1 Tax=Armadillidium nasatum TaxID=96803 RepID=A0A5N5SYD1_9CRUS|nr:Thiopurine S-methyltransferase [Armadillidium nasatum]